MDLLKKELERKKKAVEAAKQKAASQSVAGDTDRTFLKATELRRMQEEEEEQQRKRKHKSDSTDDGEKRRKQIEETDHETTAVRKERQQTSVSTSSTAQAAESIKDLPLSEVTKRLRSLGLPVRLFGESESERLSRLQETVGVGQTEIMMDEFRVGSGHGIRNAFLERQKESEQVGESLETVAVASTSTKKSSSSRKAPGNGDDASNKPSAGDDAAKTKEDTDDADDPHKRIYRFFKGLLRQWEEDLANRPEEVKRTAAGKNETKTVKQCKDYIRPLFKLCKTRRLEPSMMSHILKIVDYCEEGEFVKAHDAYMDVAIGRAAWPIGVTMVGIHARTGRSKIESANVAHVMNSELQRKYLTSVKRLMSYYQKKRDDVDPSRKVINY